MPEILSPHSHIHLHTHINLQHGFKTSALSDG